MKAFAKIRNISLPLLVQEMRIYQRGKRPYAVMLVYILTLSIFVIVNLLFAANDSVHRTINELNYMAEIGRKLFYYLSTVQMAMIALAIPAFSSVAVNGERERGTFDLLALTRLKSSSIVRQKFITVMIASFYLIISSLPVMSIAFMIGGVSPGEAGIVVAVLLLSAALFASGGIMWSCLLKNSKSAVFAAYLGTILFAFGPILIELLENACYMSFPEMAENPLLLMLILVLAGGFCALMIYLPLLTYLRKKKDRFHNRAQAIGLFGAVYITVVGMLTFPGIIDSLIGDQSVPFSFYINPFAAISAVLTEWGTYYRTDISKWIPICTSGFALIFVLLLQHFSIYRFEKMRRI